MARRIFGWHTPDDYEEADLLCRPLFVPLPFVHIVGGALAELTHLWNWEQVGTMTRERATELMTDMLRTWYEEDCVNCCQMRLNPDTGLLEFSPDGETWTPVGYGPSGGGTPAVTWPEPEPRTEVDDDDKHCAAAVNAALVLEHLYRETFLVFENSLTGAVISIASGLAEMVEGLGGIVGLTWSIQLADEAFQQSDQYTAGGFTADIRDQLTCLLYENSALALDDTVTFQFEDVRTAIGALYTAEGSPWGGINALLFFIGSDGLDHAGGVQATDELPSNCGCGWCYYQSFGSNTGGFSHIAPFTLGNNTALGWRGTFFDNNSREAIYIERLFDPAITVDQVRIIYDKSGGSGSNNSAKLELHNNGVKVAENTANPSGVDLEKSVLYSGEIDRIVIDMNTGTHATAQVTIEEIYISSNQGENPLGEDNC